MKVETDLETFKAEEKKEEETKAEAAEEVNPVKAGLERLLFQIKQDPEKNARQDL